MYSFYRFNMMATVTKPPSKAPPNPVSKKSWRLIGTVSSPSLSILDRRFPGPGARLDISSRHASPRSTESAEGTKMTDPSSVTIKSPASSSSASTLSVSACSAGIDFKSKVSIRSSRSSVRSALCIILSNTSSPPSSAPPTATGDGSSSEAGELD